MGHGILNVLSEEHELCYNLISNNEPDFPFKMKIISCGKHEKVEGVAESSL